MARQDGKERPGSGSDHRRSEMGPGAFLRDSRAQGVLLQNPGDRNTAGGRSGKASLSNGKIRTSQIYESHGN